MSDERNCTRSTQPSPTQPIGPTQPLSGTAFQHFYAPPPAASESGNKRFGPRCNLFEHSAFTGSLNDFGDNVYTANDAGAVITRYKMFSLDART